MNYLNQALTAHRQGETEQAKRLYMKQLEFSPEDQNAHQLLGVIYLAEKQLDLALMHMNKSLSINPNQPHVLTNLAAVQANMDNIEGAVNSYQKSINIAPDYLDAYLNLSKIYRLNDKLTQAYQLVEGVKGKFLHEKKFVLELGRVYKAIGDFSNLIEVYQQALKRQPLDSELRFDLALVMRLSGNANGALAIYQELAAQGMNNFPLAHNMGNAYSDIGNSDKAIECYSIAVKEKPDYLESHVNLNELLWEQGQLEHFLKSYLFAQQHYPNSGPLHFGYVKALIRTGNYQAAEQHLQILPNQLQICEEYYYFLGLCRANSGHYSSAITLLKSAVERIRSSSESLVELAKLLIVEQNYAEAREYLQQALLFEPDNQLAIAFLGVVLRLSQDSEAQKLNNYNALVGEYTVDIGEQFETIEQYCYELNKFLTSLHTSQHQPLEQTLYKGTQTRGNLFDHDHPLLTVLQENIDRCLQAYLASLPRDTTRHGIQSFDSYEYSGSWSARLKQQGYHSMHVHPMGTVSAVFYVELPKAVDSSDDKQGWLKFGEPDLPLKKKLSAEYYVQPRIGKLVFFPSYLWHGTVPFNSSEQRTTIAFDITKKQAHFN